MINQITVTGYIQGEIITRKTDKDTTVHHFGFKSKNRDACIYYRINLWGNRFDGLLPYLKENKPMLIMGDLRPPKIYQDSKGENKVSLEVNAQLIDLLPRESIIDAKAPLVPPKEELKNLLRHRIAETVALEEEVPF